MAGSDKTALRFLKFVGSSMVGGTVDIVLVWLLTGYVFTGYAGKVVISPIISFEASIIVGFMFSWFFIWNDRVADAGKNAFLKHLLAYNASNIGVFAIRMLLVVLIEKTIGGNLVIINFASRMLAGLLNFIISDKLIFRNKAKA